MRVYDGKIDKTLSLLSALELREYGFDASVSWPQLDSSELILGSDIGLELGATNLAGAAYTMVTSNDGLVSKDQIKVIGEDIEGLMGQSVSFAKIVILKIKGLTEEDSYTKIKDLERVKFRVLPEGYMLRASTHLKRETVRISKSAIKNGLSFKIIGDLLIEAYKKNDCVENVQIIFITKNSEVIKKLEPIAEEVKAITDAMNHIFDDIEFNCGSCSFSQICDEIEGMKELHKKKR